MGADEYYLELALVFSVPVLVLVALYFLHRNNKQHELYLLQRDKFLSIAAHDIRSPLSGARWGMEMLSKDLQGTNKVVADAALDSVMRVLSTISDVLDMATLEHGIAIAPQKEELDIVPLVREAVDGLKLTAQQKNVTLKFADNWPAQHKAFVDRSIVNRVIGALLSNAIKYTKENSDVTIGWNEDDRWLTVSIADQGKGLTEDDKKLFSGEYFMSRRGLKKGESGHGIGLYLTKHSVEQMGGQLRLESTPRGATFYIDLPR